MQITYLSGEVSNGDLGEVRVKKEANITGVKGKKDEDVG